MQCFVQTVIFRRILQGYLLENNYFVSYIENADMVPFLNSLAYFGPTSKGTLLSNVDRNIILSLTSKALSKPLCFLSYISLSLSHFLRFISRCFQFSSTYSTSFISRVNENSRLFHKHTAASKRSAKMESYKQRRERRWRTFISIYCLF